MKKVLFILWISFSAALVAQNQVGINQPNVDRSAVLELNSTSQGLLIPRVSSTQKGRIAKATQGLMIYERTSNAFWYFNGAGWIKITDNESIQDGIGDTDSDTRVFLDFTNDNDQIRFFTGGQLTFRMNRKRFDVLNNGNSVFLGDSAGYSDDRVNNFNVFIGTSSGLNVVGARRNVGIGYQSLRENISQLDNVAIGVFSSLSGVTASRNVAIGGNSLLTNIASDFHTVIGYKALERHVSSSGTVAVGMHALNTHTIGAYNTVIGVKALENNLDGNSNTMIGHEVGKNYLRSGSIGFGYQAGLSNSLVRSIVIDNSSTLNPLIFGNLSTDLITLNHQLHVTSNIVYVGNLTDVSDRRLKKRLKPIRKTLAQLTQLNGYRYHLKINKSDDKEYGLIAQEVLKVYPSLARRISPDSDYLGVSYVQFIPLIVEAEKEQYQQIQDLSEKLNQQEESLSSLEKELAEIKATLSVEALKP